MNFESKFNKMWGVSVQTGERFAICDYFDKMDKQWPIFRILAELSSLIPSPYDIYTCTHLFFGMAKSEW